MPDRDNGYLLVGNGTSSAVYRINPEGVLSPRVDLLATDNVGSVYQADYVLGEDGGWAFFEGQGSNGWSTRVVKFDPQTLSVLSNTYGGSFQQPRYLRLRNALSGGGAYLSGPYSGANGRHIGGGLWAGWADGPAVQDGPVVAAAASAWPYTHGIRFAGNTISWWNTNYHEAVLTTDATPDQIFNTYVRTFDALASNSVVQVSVPQGGVDSVGQVVTCELIGPIGYGQPAFSVESIRFDAASRTLAVKTLPGHPLLGWRYWRVSSPAAGQVKVELAQWTSLLPTT